MTSSRPLNGAERVCRTLEALGVDTVFGLPGAQNVALFEALRTSRLRTVVATHELGASFMANGYARASGRPGVLITIPGPGFTYALTGLAEALLDSAPLLYVLGGPAAVPGRRFQLQALDQRRIVAPLSKRVIDIQSPDLLTSSLDEAYDLCLAGEPGPVVVQFPQEFLRTPMPDSGNASVGASASQAPVESGVEEIARRLAAATRPLLFVGQGAFGAERELAGLVEALRAPLLTTTSARGVVGEDHPWVLRFDRRDVATLNELIAHADLVLALGVKFSHNGSHGFQLLLPPASLIHVDASEEVLGANFEASLTLRADVPALVRALRSTLAAPAEPVRSEWSEGEVASWNEAGARATPAGYEPTLPDAEAGTMSSFFEALRLAMPADSCLVLDSGLHQMLARRHFKVLCSRGLIPPTDFQAMGFALPAAIGAKLARPGRSTVALIGDGGFAMSALELLTAVREKIAMTIIVFNDGRYGLIHRKQIRAYGNAHGTVLRNPDIRAIAEGAGARYVRLTGSARQVLATAMDAKSVSVVEVILADPSPGLLRRVRGSLASQARRFSERLR